MEIVNIQALLRDVQHPGVDNLGPHVSSKEIFQFIQSGLIDDAEPSSPRGPEGPHGDVTFWCFLFLFRKEKNRS
jgi:hypothetical protein